MSRRWPAEPTTVTPALLRDWPLPDPSGGKEGRGRALVVGGSAHTPGAVLLAAEAALRCGAGKLQVATAASVATAVAVALPEALVVPLPETESGAIRRQATHRLRDLAAAADCVLIGPGLEDPEEAAALVRGLVARVHTPTVLDALALAAVTADRTALHALDGRVVLTPNPPELAQTLGVPVEEVDEDPRGAAVQLSATAQAVVALGGTTTWVTTPDGQAWTDPSGGAGLGVSGSGDVRAGIVAGLLARGAAPAQAAVWGGHLHGRAGERLATTVGRVGFLARELPPHLPTILDELEQS